MLPKYRGRSPVNWQLINGESNGGLTLHCMNEKPDTGDIVDQETCTILENDNPLSLFSKLENLVEPLIERNIEKTTQSSNKESHDKRRWPKATFQSTRHALNY